uniref:Uncharacterized protein n=1 Tax=Onchocerca volvulus TaxID=6282 RepID=A0A8R1XX02_ONCVO
MVMTDLKKEVTLQTKLLLNQKRGNLSKQINDEMQKQRTIHKHQTIYRSAIQQL